MLHLILDFVVIICLGVTVGFAIVLNKRLTVIHESRQDLQNFIEQFTQTMAKTEANVRDLKGVGESVFKTAQEQMQKGEALKDDLIFLLKRGEDIAQNLEDNIRTGRDLIKELKSPVESIVTNPLQSKLADNDDGSVDGTDQSLIHELRGVR